MNFRGIFSSAFSKISNKNNKKTLDFSELTIFCEQISMVLNSGISVYEGVCILEEESEVPKDKEMYQKIISDMDMGTEFPDALEATEAFPSYMIDMIRIGELSGRLDVVLDKLSQYYTREKQVRDSIKYAVSYPLMMLVMMGVVILILVAKVLPIFNSVFEELGSELTGFSKSVMDMGMAFSTALVPVLVIFAVILIAVIVFLKTNFGKKMFKQLKQKSFVSRKLSEKIAVSKFASGLYLMLASGLDTDQSLEMVLPLTEHEVVYDKIVKVRQDISEGMSFAEAIAENKIFSPRYSRILNVAYKTGATDNAIENISKRYDDEIDEDISRIISIIEPSLVAILSIVVGVILLSVMLPLMSIMSVV